MSRTRREDYAMPESYRLMIRLSPKLYAQLEARGRSGRPLAAIVREALVDYLARQPEQPAAASEQPWQPEQPANIREQLSSITATLQELQAHVRTLTTRVDALAAPQQPQAASSSNEQPTSSQSSQQQRQARRTAQTALAPAPRGGRPRGALRQRIEALLQGHPEGLSAEQIRVYVAPERPIGDILAGMRRTGAVEVQGSGRKVRYRLAGGKE